MTSWLGLAALWLSVQSATASEVVRRALVVGANDGGVDLEQLRYAEDDAARMADILTDLGGFDDASVTVLSSPAPTELMARLTELSSEEVGGQESLFLFYYSGHADPRGLLLGGEVLGYAELKHAIRDVPADIHLGILDACRSGAITRVKGATVAEPFLDEATLAAEGEAWIAASSEDEDAQESDQLRGSFFTHYLVSGLRGAADTGDGRVSLSEAYGYAHDRTVARTAGTAAGTQHPAYEFRIQGNGELPLTDVRRATAILVLPATEEGEVAVLREPENTPIAEVAKLEGREVRLALEPGRYRVRKREGEEVREVRVGLSEGSEVTVDRWGTSAGEPVARKGGQEGLQPLALGADFVPFLGSSTAMRGTDRRAVSLNLLGGYAGALRGVELSGVMNLEREDVEGVQIAGVANAAGGALRGGQLAGVASFVAGDARGAQVGTITLAGGELVGAQLGGALAVAGGPVTGVQLGALTAARSEVRGAQLSGTLAVAGGAADGLQVGAVAIAPRLRGAQLTGGLAVAPGGLHGAQLGAVTLAGEVRGLQLGAVNISTGHVAGLQLGAVNIARSSDLSLGLVNIIRDGRTAVGAWTDESSQLRVGVKHGGAHWHNTYGFGVRPYSDFPLMTTLGLGFHAPVAGPLFIDQDNYALGYHHPNLSDHGLHLVQVHRLALGVEVGRLSLLGGPTWSVAWETGPESVWDRGAVLHAGETLSVRHRAGAELAAEIRLQ